MKIDDKINKIKPYLISIRYKEGICMVDIQFKDNWQVPKSELIKVEPYKTPNLYLFYSEEEEIGLDEIVEFIDAIVNINIEREKKISLLNQKKNELNTFFTKHSFNELQRIKFIIEEPTDDTTPTSNPDSDVNWDELETKIEENQTKGK